ncbi:MAG: competence/damage-inducible protein A [Rhodothermia bacterium]|nr:MAG: competence/damage-inducible protein A [Rhodothermia bacterium]
MEAVILTIGDELLIGQVSNTNATWIAEKLTAHGVTVRQIVTVGDSEQAIRDGLNDVLSNTDLIIVTGGLGPTHDDITKVVIADHFGAPLIYQEEIYDEIVRRFEARGIPVAETNKGQAMVPEGFEVLENPIGTAPGLRYTHTTDGRHVQLILLPGVPREMKVIMENLVLPELAESGSTREIVQKTLLSTGIGESNLNELIGDLSSYLDENLKLAFLPGPAGVRLRLTAYSRQDDRVLERMASLEAAILGTAGKYFYGEGDEVLEAIVGKMLIDRQLTIATAESCTAGLVSSRMTDIPRSSEYVVGAVVAYQDRIKITVLGVDEGDLERHGAVSRQVAAQMASGVRAKFNADIGVSTSGIMGPDGGSDSKPVGTVWIAYAAEDGESAALLRLGNERLRNKAQTATAVLNLVRLRLLRSHPE